MSLTYISILVLFFLISAIIGYGLFLISNQTHRNITAIVAGIVLNILANGLIDSFFLALVLLIAGFVLGKWLFEKINRRCTS